MSSFKKGLGLLVSSNNSLSSWLEPFALSVCIYCANLHVSLAQDCLWDQVMDCWLVPNWWLFSVADCSKKSWRWKSKLVHSMQVSIPYFTITFRLQPFWLQTLVAIDSESCQRSLQSFCTPASEVDVLFDSNQLESEQRLYFLTSRRFRSASLHRIQFGRSWHLPRLPMLYFYSKTSDWYQDWAKL